MQEDRKQKENDNFFDNSVQSPESVIRPTLGERIKIIISNVASLFQERAKWLFYFLGALLHIGIFFVVWRVWLSDYLNPPLAQPAVQLESAEVTETWLIPRTEDTAVGVVHLRNKNRGYGFPSARHQSA